jgi:FHA domain
MSKPCPVCGYEKNPAGAEYCDTCGADLTISLGNITPGDSVSETTPTLKIDSSSKSEMPTPTTPTPVVPPPLTPIIPTPPILDLSTPLSPVIPTHPAHVPAIDRLAVATARLVAKQANAPTPEFTIQNSALVGVWAPGSPVDINLGDFSGSEIISQNHAEIVYKDGRWTIADMSTNGTCIKPSGQTRFDARITSPTTLNSGDEIAFANIIFIFQSP